MKYADVEYKKTKDGSFTFYSNTFEQTYHSLNGAVTESNYVFINNGLKYWLESVAEKNMGLNDDKTQEIRILEVGLGTHLNLLLTYLFFKKVFGYKDEKIDGKAGIETSLYVKSDLKVNYTGIELYPIEDESLVEAYHNLLNSSEEIKQQLGLDFVELTSIILSRWGGDNGLNIFSNGKVSLGLQKINIDFKKYLSTIVQSQNKELYDIIYFDAFSKRSQGEMWEENIFNQIFNLCNTGGVFVTYASNSELKKNLKSAGFIIQTLKGAVGKREMLRAVKP